MLPSSAGSSTVSLQDSVKSEDSTPESRPTNHDPEKGLSLGDREPISCSRGNQIHQSATLPAIPDQNSYTVRFDGTDDKWHPRNWSNAKKISIASPVCFAAFVATYSSAAFAPGTQQASQHFDVSNELAVVDTTLFILGFSFGPLVWALWSEMSGRRWPMCIGMLGSSIFPVRSAAAKDVQTLLICRFFAGVFGASPLCVVPGILSDIFDNDVRGYAIAIYALLVFAGPFTAPIVSAYLVVAEDWRWTMWFVAIIGFATTLILLCCLNETYPAVILVQKARSMRTSTGNWALHTAHERANVEVGELVQKYFSRPLRMLYSEPILLFLTIYMSFIYALVYTLLLAFPFVFQSVHSFGTADSSLPFLGLLLGVFVGTAVILYDQRRIIRQRKLNNGMLIPEWLLVPSMFCGFTFTGGLFWFAWTAYRSDIYWIVPVLAGALVGFSTLGVFLPCFMFVVEAYLPIAASAVAANIIFRSVVASVFPLFSKQMFKHLGVQWAGTLLGCIAALLAPIPFVFGAYGATLRSRSKHLVQTDAD